MDRFDMLLEMLEQSIKKNGDMNLTLSHLKNMIKKINIAYEKYSLRSQIYK